MTVSEAVGDLFDDSWGFDAIGHGVNCQGKMGSGIAVEFKNRYPYMYTQYREMCEKGWLLPGQVFPYEAEHGPQFIYNIASQFRTGRDAHLDYLEMGLLYCRFHMKKGNRKHLGLPRIGAGIGGLDFGDVLLTVDKVFALDPDIHVTVVSLEGA